MPGHDIIVVGTSAGGVEVLQILVGGLPCDLPAAIFIILHFAPWVPAFGKDSNQKVAVPIYSTTDVEAPPWASCSALYPRAPLTACKTKHTPKRSNTASVKE
jgi:CheB methylesterase